jgi:oxalate decarboxylase
MNAISRRNALTAAAAGSLLTAATIARAQSGDPVPQPQRPGHGGTDPGPRNLARDRQNPDILVPPATDHGTLPNLRFSFSDSHMRLETGGWTRQVTSRELGVSKNIAGVNMRLNAGGVRELHWHKAAEWAYMLYGTARITAIDAQGRNFIDDVGVGDSASFFGHTPDPSERYIFPAPVPGPLAADKIAGAVPVAQSFSFRLMEQQPIKTKSGTARIVDSSTFPVSKTIAAALVEVDPGGMRELHWHPNTDEWQYYIEGQARMGVFGASGQARTFDFRAGDVGFVPFAMGHYVENTSDTPLRFLEMFKSSYFADVSLNQWMALTPSELVEAHLKLDRQVMDALRKTKAPVVPA